jgi:molybdenum cofactor cytidylyltransferase
VRRDGHWLNIGEVMMQIQTILLAAGSGSRFGGDKLIAPLRDGTPLALASARVLLAAGCDVLAVVRDSDTGAGRQLAPLSGVRVLACPESALGLGCSLACGVRHSLAADAWLVMLADMPFIRPETIADVASALAQGARLAAPTIGGRRGHPVGFAHEWREQLIALTGDAGARDLLTEQSDALTRIETDDPGILRDVDRRGDLVPCSHAVPESDP